MRDQSSLMKVEGSDRAEEKGEQEEEEEDRVEENRFRKDLEKGNGLEEVMMMKRDHLDLDRGQAIPTTGKEMVRMTRKMTGMQNSEVEVVIRMDHRS